MISYLVSKNTSNYYKSYESKALPMCDRLKAAITQQYPI